MTKTHLLKGALLAATLLLAATTAQANIGETLPQLRGRYGSAKDMGGQMLFEVRLFDGQIRPAHDSANPQDHFSVTVYFDGDQSGMEIFTRNTTDPAKAVMADADITSILNSESDGQAWTPGLGPSGKPTWIRSDRKLIARLSTGQSGQSDGAPVLIVMLNTK